MPLRRPSSLVVNEPELVRELLVTNQHRVRKGAALQLSKRLLGEGLLTSEGETHARNRRLVAPAFHRQRLDGYVAVMADRTRQMLTGWEDGAEVDVHDAMTALALHIVGHTVFGVDLRRDAEGIAASLDTALATFADQPGLFAGPPAANAELDAALEHLDAVIAAMVKRSPPAPSGHWRRRPRCPTPER